MIGEILLGLTALYFVVGAALGAAVILTAPKEASAPEEIVFGLALVFLWPLYMYFNWRRDGRLW